MFNATSLSSLPSVVYGEISSGFSSLNNFGITIAYLYHCTNTSLAGRPIFIGSGLSYFVLVSMF